MTDQKWSMIGGNLNQQSRLNFDQRKWASNGTVVSPLVFCMSNGDLGRTAGISSIILQTYYGPVLCGTYPTSTWLRFFFFYLKPALEHQEPRWPFHDAKSTNVPGYSSWCSSLCWLVVGPPLWKIWKSIGMIIPNIWENKTCSKPPTSLTWFLGYHRLNGRKQSI